ncbi:hypothetical protein KUTeg_008817 [Tegillarca granosa]|uniref:Uncharacterized protein n=1 Tax=Tegillarca granosa TaxID=220873 RepID=A0ABQ9FAB5_TEGGR|nr:hypothetical protein KUTeg_008817 [Tegillarca granosa]
MTSKSANTGDTLIKNDESSTEDEMTDEKVFDTLDIRLRFRIASELHNLASFKSLNFILLHVVMIF